VKPRREGKTQEGSNKREESLVGKDLRERAPLGHTLEGKPWEERTMGVLTPGIASLGEALGFVWFLGAVSVEAS
jgi:hypothetical protein